MIPLDPFAALDAVQSAIKLVKKASQVANDVGSLGPVLGKYFDAKASAQQVVAISKNGGFKGSAMGKAIELEMALDEAAIFEEKLKMMFFQSGKADVWQKIKARAAKMEVEAAHAARQEKAAAKKKQQELDDTIEMVAFTVLGLLSLGLAGWGGVYFMLHCGKYG